MPVSLRDCKLVDASVRVGTPLVDAAQALAAAGVPTVAVLDPAGAVVGIFSEDDCVRALFPRYLGELRHTAFLDEDVELAAHVEKLSTTRVEEAAQGDPPVLGVDASTLHAAELFLHYDWGALPVVDESKQFAGMLLQSEFIRVVLGALPSA